MEILCFGIPKLWLWSLLVFLGVVAWFRCFKGDDVLFFTIDI